MAVVKRDAKNRKLNINRSCDVYMCALSLCAAAAVRRATAQNGGAENTGVENAGGGKCRSGKCRSDKVWKAIRKNTLKHQTKYGCRGFLA